MSSFWIKIIALITMLIDHIGFAFFPENLLLRIIGRISMPLFAFQIAVGFDKTKSREKYIIRMLIFALVSQIPFGLLYNIQGITAPLNMRIYFFNFAFNFVLVGKRETYFSEKLFAYFLFC